MSNERKSILSRVMNLAWQFVKKNGFSMSEALKTAWRNIKLNKALKSRIVEFYFKKVDGSTRQAFGTLKESLIAETKGTGRKTADNIQVYFDSEKGEYRCFKKCNLISFI